MSKVLCKTFLSPEQAINTQIDNICHDVSLSVVKKYYKAFVENDENKMEKILKSNRYTAPYNIERHLENLILTYGKSQIDNKLK